MSDVISKLQNTYFYFSFDGHQYQIQLLMIAVLALILLILALDLLIIAVLSSMKTREKGDAKAVVDRKIDGDTDDLLRKVEMKYEIIESRSLDQRYAEARGMVICPYCETFNSQTSEKCCACGQTIHK